MFICSVWANSNSLELESTKQAAFIAFALAFIDKLIEGQSCYFVRMDSLLGSRAIPAIFGLSYYLSIYAHMISKMHIHFDIFIDHICESCH